MALKKKKDQRDRKGSWILIFAFLLLFLFPAFCQGAEAESSSPVNEPVTNPSSLSITFEYGTPFHIWSDRLYSPFQLATLSLTYEKESGLWPFTKNPKLVKSFLLELQLTHIWGNGIGLDVVQVSQETWDKAVREGREPTVDWDHYQIALVPYYRFYYPLTKAVRLYFEAGIGLALLNKPLIEDGTVWNFLFTGGFGLNFKYKIPFNISLKLQHFSNGGDANLGITHQRVVGPETLMFGLGIRFPLGKKPVMEKDRPALNDSSPGSGEGYSGPLRLPFQVLGGTKYFVAEINE